MQTVLSPHPPSPRLRRRASRPALAALLLVGGPLAAQTVSTVRETEFRSRWADQQVDRPQLEVGQNIPLRDMDGTFGGAVSQAMTSLFRTGPVVFRGGLNVGVEYTSQTANANFTSQPSTSSLFAAPTLAAFYDREVGPWTISARYSVGYMYYFDRNYVAAGGFPGIPGQKVTVVTEPARTEQVRDPSRDTVEFVNGIRVVRPAFRTENVPAKTEQRVVGGQPARPAGDMLPSQTAGIDFQLTLSRLTVRSSGGASFGTGFDTNRGSNQDRLAVNEALTADYQITEYIRAGVLLGASYERNEQFASNTNRADIFTRYNGSFYTDYFITGKTRLRFELGGGVDSRDFAAGTQQEQQFAQVQLRANYEATEKLNFEGSIGFGNTSITPHDPGVQDGARNIYSFTANYRPTEKLTARLYFGLEANALQPEFSLQLGWTPRENTALSLSLYQLSGAATLNFTQNRISRGFLLTLQQRLFTRGTLLLTGGLEEYEDINAGVNAAPLEPFSFMAISYSHQFSRWLALEAFYRHSSQATSIAGTGGANENRASLSLRLTF